MLLTGDLQLMCKDMPPLLPKPDSIVAMRAPFATHSLWVAPYDAKQLYPAGKFVPRELKSAVDFMRTVKTDNRRIVETLKTPEDSILSFVAGEKNIRNTDIALWLTWGTTHVPRSGRLMTRDVVTETDKIDIVQTRRRSGNAK